MGMTIMIIMGLLSVVAISSIDFDQLDELRARIEEERAEMDEEVIEDTNDLGWLDVPVDEEVPNIDLLQENFLNFATALEMDNEAAMPAASVPAEVDDIVAKDQEDPFDSFDQSAPSPEENFSLDPLSDLWPFEEQSDDEEVAQADADGEPEAATDLINLNGFDAEVDAMELPYVPKQDATGVDLVPEVSVTHHDGWTEVGIDDDAHAFAHTASNDFKGLVPEDVLLRPAA